MAKKKSAGVSMYGDSDWQAEDDMRTLARAEEIRADPARLKKALAKAKEKVAELNKITGNAPAKK